MNASIAPEAVASVDPYWYELAKRREEERRKITIRNGTITLTFDGSYQIQLERIRTERDLLAWVFHLTDKPWMTSERLHVFVEKVATHRGFKLPGSNGGQPPAENSF